MNSADDRRNTSPGRRLGNDRRASATDLPYTGPERRDGGERRYGASRRTVRTG